MLTTLAQELGTPTYIYSADLMREKARAFQEALRGLPTLVCFAVKANSNLAVLNLFKESGLGLDLVSGGELARARKINLAGEKIVFSGVGKTDQEILDALHYGSKGIFAFMVESMEELARIEALAKTAGKVARVGIRFNPNIDAKTHPHISTGKKENKFGIEEKDVLKSISQYKNSAHVLIRGLSIHIGSQLIDLKPIERAFTKLKKLADTVHAKNPLEFVDLGGGLGVPYENEKIPSFEAYGSLVRKIFGKSPYRLVFEPGRALCAESGVLLSRVLIRKKAKPQDFLILDAGMNDLMRPALYGSYHPITLVSTSATPKGQKAFRIVGPVCETSDAFAMGRKLSDSVAPGDLVTLDLAGAYGFSMANQYNTRCRPAEVLVEGNQYRVIRPREKLEDLFREESTQ